MGSSPIIDTTLLNKQHLVIIYYMQHAYATYPTIVIKVLQA